MGPNFVTISLDSFYVKNQFLGPSCEGDGDVVGVLTPLRGGAQVVLHGAQVLELRVLLGVHQEGEREEDGEGQVESRKGGR